MKRSALVGAVLAGAILLGTAGCAKSADAMMREIAMGEATDTVRERHNSFSGMVQYVSYSVYKDFSQEQMEALGKALFELGGEESRNDMKCSIAFYEGDSDTLLHAFYYDKDGVKQDDPNAYYIPGNKFDEFEPEV